MSSPLGLAPPQVHHWPCHLHLELNLPGLGSRPLQKPERPVSSLPVRPLSLAVCRCHLSMAPCELSSSVEGVLVTGGVCFGTSAEASSSHLWQCHRCVWTSHTWGVPAHAHCGIRDSGRLGLLWDTSGSPEPGGPGGPSHTPKTTGHWVIQPQGCKDIKRHFLALLIFPHPNSQLDCFFCLLGYVSQFCYGMWNIESICTKLAQLPNLPSLRNGGREMLPAELYQIPFEEVASFEA